MLLLHALAVGLGDCLVIEFPDRSVGIVDCGQQGGAQVGSRLRAYLQGNWPAGHPPRVRFVLVTHPHLDHDSSVLDVLTGTHDTIERFFHLDAYPPVSEGTPEPNWFRYLGYARTQFRRGYLLNPPEGLRAGQRIDVGHPDVDVDVLNPTDRLAQQATTGNTHALNRASIVLQVTYHEHVLLLGADAANEIWNDIVARPEFRLPTVFKAPHHGSGTEGFPMALLPLWRQPLVTLFSCPSGDPAHPASEVLHRFQRKPRSMVRCTGFADRCRWEPVTPLRVDSTLAVARRLTLQTLPQIARGDETHLCCGNIRVEMERGERPRVRIEGSRQVRRCDERRRLCAERGPELGREL